MKRTKKGISLIVLIITIAVIIILATAVILAIANNRPIESAKEATKAHNNSVLLENAAVLSAQWKTDSLLNKTTKSRSDYVQDGLKSQGFTEEEVGSIIVDEETGEVTLDGKGGNDDEPSTGNITAKEVAGNPTKFYGKYVDNYTESSQSGVKWKIFYSDGNNIYLIADDYIPTTSVPENLAGHKAESYTSSESYTHDVYFTTDVLGDYTGSASITDSKLQNLNSKYFEYLTTSGKTSKNSNMKAVAYMLDTKAWEKFKGEKAEYAIGGPTSEIFIKSWNAKYPDSKIEYQVADISSSYKADNGYTYKKGSDNWSTYISYAFRKSDSTYDDLYVITDQTKANGVWLASPSGNDAYYLSDVYRIGGLYHNEYNNFGKGFRPLVCLKSSVKLEEQSENKYIIK